MSNLEMEWAVFRVCMVVRASVGERDSIFRRIGGRLEGWVLRVCSDTESGSVGSRTAAITVVWGRRR